MAGVGESPVMMEDTSAMTSLIAGGIAGIATDMTIFPIDTIKTRLQAKEGFRKSGGFRSVYRGIGSVAVGTVPSGASFFLAYDFSKKHTRHLFSSQIASHMLSGCIAEFFSCMFRIPFEVVKQRAQAFSHLNSRSAFMQVISTEGIRGFTRGFSSMVFREVPFTLIQMPIWEYLKSEVSKHNNGNVSALQSGLCGSVGGGIAAAITTPLDVAKTRIILAQNTGSDTTKNPFRVVIQIARNEGVSALFSGIIPRIIWIATGGFVFLGAYDQTKILLKTYGKDP